MRDPHYTSPESMHPLIRKTRRPPGPCAGHPAQAGWGRTHISEASLQKAVHFFLGLSTYLFAATNFSKSFTYVSEGHKNSTYT